MNLFTLTFTSLNKNVLITIILFCFLFSSGIVCGQLGATQNQFLKIDEKGGNADGNSVINNSWLLRSANGTGWMTAHLVDGISVDVSYINPAFDTRTWWRRDPYNNIQSWGDQGNTLLTLKQGKLGIGVINPSSWVDISTGTTSVITSALSIYRNGDPNLGMKLLTGNGDGADYNLWNGGLGGWNGIAFHSTFDNVTRGVFNLRNGDFSLKGTITSEASAIIRGNITAGTDGGVALISGPAFSGAIQIKTHGGLGGAANRYLRLGIKDNNSVFYPALSINDDLNVGIGTTIPDARLTVKGTIHSQEVRVDLNVPGPDYVFEPTYTLPPLDSVQLYINQNKHLPEVPSAKEMEANGVNLGKMNILLLKKVEELTLYQIESNKRIERLQHQIDDLKKLKN